LVVFVLTMIFMVTSMIAINALYVAGEFATVSARKSRVTQAAVDGSRMAKILLPIIEDSHKLDNYIAASQVGITLSSIVLGIYGQRQIAPVLEPLLIRLPIVDNQAAAAGIASTLVLILLTILQVVLGELVPKTIAIQYPERTAYATVLPMKWSADIILRPLIILLNGSGIFFMKLLGVSHEGGHRHVHSPEEIQFLIEQSHQGGLLNAEERELLGNALRIGDMKVNDVFIPRIQMVAIEADKSVAEVLQLVLESRFTRIPVYDDDIDHIIGMVHLKDMFRLYRTDSTQNVRGCLRKVSFVPETMSTNDVWETFNRERTYMAIVFDEYGGTVGMVTREDLIEELFGDVQDEFDDDEEQEITKIADFEYRVQGLVSLADLNDKLELSLPMDEAHTINGLLINRLERMPVVGDMVQIEGIELEVQSVAEHAADQLILRLAGGNKEQAE
jgi:putative hemolysin